MRTQTFGMLIANYTVLAQKHQKSRHKNAPGDEGRKEKIRKSSPYPALKGPDDQAN